MRAAVVEGLYPIQRPRVLGRESPAIVEEVSGEIADVKGGLRAVTWKCAGNDASTQIS
jgi:hypothetical protein